MAFTPCVFGLNLMRKFLSTSEGYSVQRKMKKQNKKNSPHVEAQKLYNAKYFDTGLWFCVFCEYIT